MKLLKKWSSIFVLALTVALVSPISSHLGSTLVAQAATVKISQKTLTLNVGNSKTLKVSGTNKKVTWSTSQKAVAVVSSEGKVTAKKVGSTIITAVVDKKKYTCKVTVKSQVVVNPLIKNAPFAAQETSHDKLKFIIPKTWKQIVSAEQGNAALLIFLPVDADAEKGSSNVSVNYAQTGKDKPDYDTLKATLEEILTPDYLTSQYTKSGLTAKITDFKTSDSDTKLGKAFKAEYTIELNGVTFKQTVYEIYINNYNFEITITNIGDELNPHVNTVGDYIIETLKITK